MRTRLRDRAVPRRLAQSVQAVKEKQKRTLVQGSRPSPTQPEKSRGLLALSSVHDSCQSHKMVQTICSCLKIRDLGHVARAVQNAHSMKIRITPEEYSKNSLCLSFLGNYSTSIPPLPQCDRGRCKYLRFFTDKRQETSSVLVYPIFRS